VNAQLREAKMAQLYFDCSSTGGVMLDRRERCVEDLLEAREYAARVILSLISMPSREDWRDWVMHVSDDEGEEVFVVPFSSPLGKPH
jgi:ribosomal protein S24E